jgi:histidinol dehydrogenase
VKIIYAKNKNFFSDLKKILQKRSQQNILSIDNVVKKIILDVIKRGDKALIEYSMKFDGAKINKKNILLSQKKIKSYKNKIDSKTMNAFKVAIANVTKFHKKQKPKNFILSKKGVKTSMLWKPIKSVGLYIPGGSSAYPSSVIMNVIPAKVAGVERIVVTTPSNFGEINPYVLALLDELNIGEIYQVGGAQAIAALAYGTDSIQQVNKIFGPGNAYVASAKKQVFGKVGIDLIAGPSEIVVVADKNNNPKWVAADLIAQAEHDELAQSILITDDKNFAEKVIDAIDQLTLQLSKKSIIKKSLNKFGIIIITDNFINAEEIIDYIAPEHLHLQNKLRYKMMKNINNAGGIFIGEYASEAFGDYIVGTNHVLPTSGSAKFSSGLGVLDFMKRTSVVEMDSSGYDHNQSNVSKMAEIENLDGHKLSVKIRQIDKK